MFQEYSLSLRKRKDEIWNSKTILDGFSVMPTFTRHALDLLIYKGYEFMLGPNGTMKMAFEDGLILDHDNWRKMAKSRNTLSHVYDEDEVLPIVRLIYSDYAPLLKQLDKSLGELSQKQDYQQA